MMGYFIKLIPFLAVRKALFLNKNGAAHKARTVYGLTGKYPFFGYFH